MDDENKEKSTWDYIKDGFKPAAARADEEVSMSRKAYGDQFQKDRDAGAQVVRDKFKKGFFGN